MTVCMVYPVSGGVPFALDNREPWLLGVAGLTICIFNRTREAKVEA